MAASHFLSIQFRNQNKAFTSKGQNAFKHENPHLQKGSKITQTLVLIRVRKQTMIVQVKLVYLIKSLYIKALNKC